MKLLIKQTVFSIKSKFDIWNEQGVPRFYAEGEIFTLGSKLHISDMYGREVIYIAQRLFSFLPRYEVSILGNEPFCMKKEFTLFRQEYTVEDYGITVTGDFFAHDYTVERNGVPIAFLSKQWLTWGDTYVLDIPNPADELLALSCILVIDCVMADADNAAQ